MEKTSFAFAPLIIGPMLAYMGYVAGAIEQTPSALNALYIAIALLPCAAYLASIPLLAVYDLTEAKLNHASDPDA